MCPLVWPLVWPLEWALLCPLVGPIILLCHKEITDALQTQTFKG